MLKAKTIVGIRKNTNPLFLSVASGDASAKLSAYNDPEHATLFIAQQDDDKVAFSPITGKKAQPYSIGSEVAMSNADLKEFKAIGKCAQKECGCTLLTTPALAALLEKASETTIACTACGNEMKLDYDAEHAEIVGDAGGEEDEIDEDDVGDEDIVEDDEPVEDDEEDAEVAKMMKEIASDEDEDEEDPDAVEDDEDEEDIDEEIARLSAEIAAEEGEDDGEKKEDDKKPAEEKPAEENKPDPRPGHAPDDGQDSTGNVKGADGEVAADDKEPEVKAEDDKDSGETLAYAMHRLVDPTKGKTRVLFVDADTAMLAHTPEGSTERHLGTFSRTNAAAESAKLFDNRSMFGKVATQLIASGALAGDAPSEDLAKMGFKSIMLELPLNVAMASKVNEAVATATAAAQAEASTKVADVAKNFSKLVAIASVGLDKGLIGDKSFYKDLASSLHTMGIRNAGTIAKRICEAKLKPFLAAVIEQAQELSTKSADYVAGQAESIAKASYASIDDNVEQLTTVHQDDSNEEEQQIAVASLDAPSHRPSTSAIQGALRRIGRRG